MRPIIPFIILALLTSCHANKEVVTDSFQQTDSITRSESHRTFALNDSVLRNIDFRFDTLNINIQRPVEYTDTPEVITLSVINGEIVDKRHHLHNHRENYTLSETIAFEQVNADASAEHSDDSRIFDPPDATTVIIVAFVIIAIITAIFHRLRKS